MGIAWAYPDKTGGHLNQEDASTLIHRCAPSRGNFQCMTWLAWPSHCVMLVCQLATRCKSSMLQSTRNAQKYDMVFTCWVNTNHITYRPVCGISLRMQGRRARGDPSGHQRHIWLLRVRDLDRCALLLAAPVGSSAICTLQAHPTRLHGAGKAIAGNREAYTIATKFGAWSGKGPDGAVIQGVNGDPAYVRKAVEGSLQRLGVDSIDLYYQHRCWMPEAGAVMQGRSGHSEPLTVAAAMAQGGPQPANRGDLGGLGGAPLFSRRLPAS